MPEGAQGPGYFYTLKGIDTSKKVDCRDHVDVLPAQVLLTKDGKPIAVEPVLCYNYYSPVKSFLDARDTEKFLKEMCISIIRKTVATHTAFEFITDKKKLQTFIRVGFFS